MILVGNQRGGSKQLALHLLKEDNEHVWVHELRGFVAADLRGAFNEAYAVSRGGKCRQYLFSLSLNPPKEASVTIEAFESAIERVENKLGLNGLPRAIVFHEKNGRRHAHAVWSRIKPDDLKAVHLSYTHRKLMAISRELYLEHGWTMPRGLAQSGLRDPKNFTLAQWQQSQRMNKDPRAIKTALQDAWAISDGKNSFIAALQERGYYLARGDRRGFVAIDIDGHVYSLPRWIGVRANAVRERLGEESQLDSVTVVCERIADEIRPAIKRMRVGLLRETNSQNQRLRNRLKTLTTRQRTERGQKEAEIENRWWAESRARQARFRTGLPGIWDWARGENARIRARNLFEAEQAQKRDQQELDAFIFGQLAERQHLIDLRRKLASQFAISRRDIQKAGAVYDRLGKPVPSQQRHRQKRRLE